MAFTRFFIPLPLAVVPRAASAMEAATVKTLMPGFRKCVELCNDAADKKGDFVPFSVEGKTVGYMLPSFTAKLADFGDVFKVIGHMSISTQQLCKDTPTTCRNA